MLPPPALVLSDTRRVPVDAAVDGADEHDGLPDC